MLISLKLVRETRLAYPGIPSEANGAVVLLVQLGLMQITVMYGIACCSRYPN